mgnify:CR=1 FL=1
MIQSLRDAVFDYAAGVEDRFGGSKLSTVLALMKAKGIRDTKLASDVLVEILADKDALSDSEDELFLALSRVAKALDLKNSRIAGLAEQLITSNSLDQRPKAIAQLVELFVETGGDLTPKTLESLSNVKSLETRQWVYFAVNRAYVGDAKALAGTLSSLLSDASVDWQWDYFIDYIDDILKVYDIEGFEVVFKKYAEAIDSQPDKEGLYSFYKQLTGRNYRPARKLKATRPKQKQQTGVTYLSQPVVNRLKGNPTKAARALHDERPRVSA